MRLEPFLVHVKGRRYGQDMRVLGFEKVGQAQLRQEESASDIDLMHQVVPLEAGVGGVCGTNR